MDVQDPMDTLNLEQRAAATHFEGAILVLAGAGSGKTRVLTTRVWHLIHEYGVDPAAILAVTFTNKAAGEMRTRIQRLLGREPAGMWTGTFHSVGARLLRRHAGQLGWDSNFSIFDADQSLRQMKRTLEAAGHSPKRWHPRAVASAISGAKNALVGPEEYARLAADVFSRVVAEVYPRYQAALREQNAFDFDDLLVKPVELFESDPLLLGRYRQRFAFILVDEYQDTNHAQYRFVQLLAEGHGNLMVVGDDDQSIYGWRGADVANILDFEKDFPDTRTVRLERNYRSTANILHAANRVIAENARRKGKTLHTTAPEGPPLTLVECVDERDEADWIGATIENALTTDPERTARDFTILYRTNAQSRALEEAFRRRDLPYQIVGGTRFYERREIMDVLAYLRLISNPRDAGAFERIVNVPRRGIGNVSQGHLFTWAAERGLAPLEAAACAADVDALRGAAGAAFEAFAGVIGKYAGLAEHLGAGELLARLLEEIGLINALVDEGPEGEERADNVRELVAGAHEFDALEDPDEEPEDAAVGRTALDRYLQKVALVTDVDRHDSAADAVTLMTVHNAKGLEFPGVFVAGLEDGLFPLARTVTEPDEFEEERRLFYVALTRAQQKVWMTWARTRRRAGEVKSCSLSGFVAAVPREVLEEKVTPALTRARSMGSVRPRARRTGVGSLGWQEERERREAAQDREPVIDYDYAQEAPRFVKGERVRHAQFGRGVIRGLTGFGQDTKAVVEFERVGRKKVVLRYANLQKEL
ncbi:MAG: UvrD-helicase domain-containing protein [Gemmatimonadota bacterium]